MVKIIKHFNVIKSHKEVGQVKRGYQTKILKGWEGSEGTVRLVLNLDEIYYLKA